MQRFKRENSFVLNMNESCTRSLDFTMRFKAIMSGQVFKYTFEYSTLNDAGRNIKSP